MKTAEPDRRIRKTKALIRGALTRLLMEKDLKDISILEITELADVNRGTFYLHYKDIYDLFEQMEAEVMADFSGILFADNRAPERDEWMSILLKAFQYIAQNEDVFRAILRTRESRFLTQIIEIGRPKTKKEWEKLFGKQQEEYYEYLYAFLTSGCVTMLKLWFENGMPVSLEKMAALAQNLMFNSISNLSKA